MGPRDIADGGTPYDWLCSDNRCGRCRRDVHTGTPPSPEAAEQARKIAVAFSFTTSLSLLIGAFVASAAGALGGFHRDEA